MGMLTTHVLDTAAGRPARNVRVELRHHPECAVGSVPLLVVSATTNDDGRVVPALLEGPLLRIGRYTLTFHMAEYFRKQGVELPDPPFLDEIVIPFGIAQADAHYHVPLLVSPWSFSTYRGS